MSCSSQAPKSMMPGEVMRVNLSHPWLARTPKTVPSLAPGLASTGTHDEVATAMTSARSRKSTISSPMTAPGTMPKFESAE